MKDKKCPSFTLNNLHVSRDLYLREEQGATEDRVEGDNEHKLINRRNEWEALSLPISSQ